MIIIRHLRKNAWPATINNQENLTTVVGSVIRDFGSNPPSLLHLHPLLM